MLGGLTLLFWFLAGLATAGASVGFISGELASLVVIGACAALAALFLLSFLLGFVAGGKYTSWISLLLGLPAVAAAGFWGYQRFKVPVSDFSTDLVTPPKFIGPGLPFPVEKGKEFLDPETVIDRSYPEANAGTQIRYFPDFKGLPVKASGPDTYQRLVKVLRDQLPDAEVVYDDPKKMHAEIVVTVPVIRLADDIAFDVRFDPRMPLDSQIEMRCRARLPVADAGLCFWRIQDLTARLGVAMKALESDVQHKIAMTPEPTATGTGTSTTTETGTSTATTTATATAPAPAAPPAAAPAKPAPAKPAPAPAKPPTAAKPAPAKPGSKK